MADGRELISAAQANDAARVSELLDRQPELVAFRDETDWTPLHWMAANRYPGMVELLLSRGADPNARGRAGETPLHLAQNRAIAAALVAAGADPRARDRNGSTPVSWAAREGDLALWQVLEGSAPVDN